MPFKKFPGKYATEKISIGKGPNDAIPDNKYSIDYYRKCEMARSIFRALYGKQTNGVKWFNFALTSKWSQLDDEAMKENDRFSPKPQAYTQGKFPAFFENHPGERLNMFMPDDMEFHYVSYNANTGTYEVSDEIVPAPENTKYKVRYEKAKAECIKELNAVKETEEYKKAVREAKSAINSEYKANYSKFYQNEATFDNLPEIPLMENDVPDMVKVPEPADAMKPKEVFRRKIERPEMFYRFPGKIADQKLVNQTLADQKLNGTRQLLTTLYGNNPEIWKGAVVGSDMKALGTIPFDKDEGVLLDKNEGVQNHEAKTIEEKITGFFDNNPYGKLLIYVPTDKSVHYLTRVNNTFSISVNSVNAPGNEVEDRELNDLIKNNYDRIEPLIQNEDPAFLKDVGAAILTAEEATKALAKEKLEVKEKSVPVKPLKDVERFYKKEQFWEYLNGISDYFSQAGDLLVNVNTPEAFDVKKSLSSVKYSLDALIAGGSFSLGESGYFRESVKSATEKISSFLSAAKDRKLTAAEKACLATLGRTHELLTDEDELIAHVQRAFDINDNFGKEMNTGLLDAELAEYKSIPNLGKRPSVEELRNLNIYTSKPKDVMAALLWGASMDYMGDRSVPGFEENVKEKNFFNERLDMLKEELKNAPLDVLVEYNKAIILTDLSVKDKAHEFYQNALKNAPENIEDKELYAKKALFESPEYATLNAFASFRSLYAMTHMSDVIVSSVTNMYSVPYSINEVMLQRESNYMGDWGAHELADYFKGKGLKNYMDEFEEDAYSVLVEKSGYTKKTPYSELAENYCALMDDKEKASESFVAMRNTMKALMSLDASDPTNYEYKDKLESALNAASAYSESHTGFHFTKNGDKRLELSNKIIDTILAIKVDIAEKEFEAEEKLTPEERKLEKARKAARAKEVETMIGFDARFKISKQLDGLLGNAAIDCATKVSEEEFINAFAKSYFNQPKLDFESFSGEIKNITGQDLKEPEATVRKQKELKQQRAAVSIAKAAYRMNNTPATEAQMSKLEGIYRSVSRFSFTPGDAKNNKHMLEELTSGDTKRVTAACIKAFSRYQNIDKSLYDHPLSDDEIIDRYPEIFSLIAPLGMELENFISDAARLGADMNNPKLKGLIQETEKLAKGISAVSTFYDGRIKELASEYYPYLPDGYEYDNEFVGEDFDDDTAKGANSRFQSAFDHSFRNQALAENIMYNLQLQHNKKIECVYTKDGKRFSPKNQPEIGSVIGSKEPMLVYFEGDPKPIAISADFQVPAKIQNADISLFKQARIHHEKYGKPILLVDAKAGFEKVAKEFTKGRADKNDLAHAALFFIGAKKGITEEELLKKYSNEEHIEKAFDNLSSNDIKSLMKGDINNPTLELFVSDYDLIARTTGFDAVLPEEQETKKALKNSLGMSKCQQKLREIIDTAMKLEKEIHDNVLTEAQEKEYNEKIANNIISPLHKTLANMIAAQQIFNEITGNKNISNEQMIEAMSADNLKNRTNKILGSAEFKRITDEFTGLQPEDIQTLSVEMNTEALLERYESVQAELTAEKLQKSVKSQIKFTTDDLQKNVLLGTDEKLLPTRIATVAYFTNLGRQMKDMPFDELKEKCKAQSIVTGIKKMIPVAKDMVEAVNKKDDTLFAKLLGQGDIAGLVTNMYNDYEANALQKQKAVENKLDEKLIEINPLGLDVLK